jgi:hypothetical protein
MYRFFHWTNLKHNFNKICSCYYPNYHLSLPVFIARAKFRVCTIHQTDQWCTIMVSAHWPLALYNGNLTFCTWKRVADGDKRGWRYFGCVFIMCLEICSACFDVWMRGGGITKYNKWQSIPREHCMFKDSYRSNLSSVPYGRSIELACR